MNPTSPIRISSSHQPNTSDPVGNDVADAEDAVFNASGSLDDARWRSDGA